MKTSQLTGRALDYAVALAEGIPAEEIKLPAWKGGSLFRYLRDEEGNLDGRYQTGPGLIFSAKWEAGGPIIAREGIGIGKSGYGWLAAIDTADGKSIDTDGLTPLVAAMRAFVVARLGPEIEIPKELQPKCQRCDSPLNDEGRCTDLTCPFSDCQQSDPTGWAGHPEKP